MLCSKSQDSLSQAVVVLYHGTDAQRLSDQDIGNARCNGDDLGSTPGVFRDQVFLVAGVEEPERTRSRVRWAVIRRFLDVNLVLGLQVDEEWLRMNNSAPMTSVFSCAFAYTVALVLVVNKSVCHCVRLCREQCSSTGSPRSVDKDYHFPEDN